MPHVLYFLLGFQDACSLYLKPEWVHVYIEYVCLDAVHSCYRLRHLPVWFVPKMASNIIFPTFEATS